MRGKYLRVTPTPEQVTLIELLVSEPPEWTSWALCLEVGVEGFFPSDRSEASDGEFYRTTRRVCAACEVVDECLEYGLDLDPENSLGHGMFGGKSPAERLKIRRARRAS